jgi:hypothetical protein
MPILAALAGLLAGCQSPERTTLGDGPSPPEFPDVKYLLNPATILHEVRLCYEMDRAPKEDAGIEQPVFQRVPHSQESYIFGFLEKPTLHRFSYKGGKFLVGDFSYPAEENSILYILMERPGNFSFRFHDRRITVERPTEWKPAVFYRQVEEVKDLAGSPQSKTSRSKSKTRKVQTRVVREELQVGPHRITLLPGNADWQVNGFRVRAEPGGTIVIDREGVVRTS